MPPKLAFFTVGIMHEPVGHPRVQGFLDRVAGVYAAADRKRRFSVTLDPRSGDLAAFLGLSP